MAKKLDLTRFSLANLAVCWGFSFCSGRNKMTRSDFCKRIFPTWYSLDSIPIEPHTVWTIPGRASSSNFRDFMRGNTRGNGGFAYSSLSKDLRDKLLSDEPVFSPFGQPITHRVSMLLNIQKLMDDSEHYIDGGTHNIFTKYAFRQTEKNSNNDPQTVPKEVQAVVDGLLAESNDRKRQAYALFLVILSSIYHQQMCNQNRHDLGYSPVNKKCLNDLLKPDVIQESIDAMDAMPADKTISLDTDLTASIPGFSIFSIPGYLDHYQFFLMRVNGTIFDHGTLDMWEDHDGVPRAKLCLQFE